MGKGAVRVGVCRERVGQVESWTWMASLFKGFVQLRKARHVDILPPTHTHARTYTEKHEDIRCLIQERNGTLKESIFFF